MFGYRPIREQPRRQQTEIVTWWDLLVRATKAKVGKQNIRVLPLPATKNALETLKKNLDLSIDHADPEPREVSRTTLDINVKDYVNYGDKDHDETLVKIVKSTSEKEGRKYNLIATKGSMLDLSSGFGVDYILQAGLNAKYSQKKETTTTNESSKENELVFGYHHEEKVHIPPGMKVTVKVTTSSVRYQQDYTLRFSISSWYSIDVSYNTNACCTCGPTKCRVNVRDILRTLPEFQDNRDGKVSFTQSATLEWVGEGCDVKKIEKPLVTLINN